jgi:hypothetical protein
VLEPGEEGQLEFSLDTRRFFGRRTQDMYLKTDNGKVVETIFRIIADSQDQVTGE